MLASIALLALSSHLVAASSYSASYLPNTLPNVTEAGQIGTNQCGQYGASSQDSLCQNAYVNSLEDFCVWSPPYSDGTNATIPITERIEVAWCTKPGYGTRLLPPGTITGAHFVKTSLYVQLTGIGDFTKIGVPAGDSGGELDPHGADGNGNPEGGIVFTNATGTLAQAHEWTSFMSATQFCFRVCFDSPVAQAYCQHQYDVMGCDWNMPANYDDNVIESCDGDTDLPMGLYVQPDGTTSTFHEGQAVTPDAHPIASSSNCVTIPGLPSNNVAAFVTPVGAAAASSTGSSGAVITGSVTSLSGGAVPTAGATISGGEPAKTGAGGATTSTSAGSSGSTGSSSTTGQGSGVNGGWTDLVGLVRAGAVVGALVIGGVMAI